MRIFLHRALALLLASCLVADPAYALSFVNGSPRIRESVTWRRPLFEKQALIASSWVQRPIQWLKQAGRLSKDEPRDTSRRDFFGDVAAVVGASVVLFPGTSQATVSFRPGLGELQSQPISFIAFDERRFLSDITLRREVLPMMDAAIFQQLAIAERAPFVGYTDASWQARQGIRGQLVRGMLASGARAELEEIRASLNRPWPSQIDEQNDHWIYLVLPRYFARRGILMKLGFARITSAPQRMPSLQELSLMESFGLFRVGSVETLTRTIWGEASTVQAVHIVGPFVHEGRGLGGPASDALAQGMYGNVVIYDDHIDEAATYWHDAMNSRRDLIPLFAEVSWHPDIRVAGRYVDPLLFAHSQLTAQEAAHLLSVDAYREWFFEQNRVHEFQHILDERRGRVSADQLPLDSWAGYDETINRWFVANELDARLAEMRHVAIEHKKRELLRFLGEVLETKENREFRLTALHLVDLVISEIAGHPDRYPEVRLFAHDTLTQRAQIAAQLGSLTPEHIDQILDAVHQVREQDPLALFMPQAVDHALLYRGDLHQGTFLERRGGQVAGIAVAAVAAGVGGLAWWRWKRMSASTLVVKGKAERKAAKRLKGKKGTPAGMVWDSELALRVMEALGRSEQDVVQILTESVVAKEQAYLEPVLTHLRDTFLTPRFPSDLGDFLHGPTYRLSKERWLQAHEEGGVVFDLDTYAFVPYDAAVHALPLMDLFTSMTFAAWEIYSNVHVMFFPFAPIMDRETMLARRRLPEYADAVTKRIHARHNRKRTGIAGMAIDPATTQEELDVIHAFGRDLATLNKSMNLGIASGRTSTANLKAMLVAAKLPEDLVSRKLKSKEERTLAEKFAKHVMKWQKLHGDSATIPPLPATPQDVHEYMRRGKVYFEQGRYLEARNQFVKAVNESKEGSRAYTEAPLWIGRAASAGQDHAEVIGLFGRTASEPITNLRVAFSLYLVADAHTEKGEWRTAEHLFKRVLEWLESTPGSRHDEDRNEVLARTLFGLGSALYQRNDAAALTYYQRAADVSVKASHVTPYEKAKIMTSLARATRKYSTAPDAFAQSRGFYEAAVEDLRRERERLDRFYAQDPELQDGVPASRQLALYEVLVRFVVTEELLTAGDDIPASAEHALAFMPLLAQYRLQERMSPSFYSELLSRAALVHYFHSDLDLAAKVFEQRVMNPEEPLGEALQLDILWASIWARRFQHQGDLKNERLATAQVGDPRHTEFSRARRAQDEGYYDQALDIMVTGLEDLIVQILPGLDVSPVLGSQYHTRFRIRRILDIVKEQSGQNEFLSLLPEALMILGELASDVRLFDLAQEAFELSHALSPSDRSALYKAVIPAYWNESPLAKQALEEGWKKLRQGSMPNKWAREFDDSIRVFSERASRVRHYVKQTLGVDIGYDGVGVGLAGWLESADINRLDSYFSFTKVNRRPRSALVDEFLKFYLKQLDYQIAPKARELLAGRIANAAFPLETAEGVLIMMRNAGVPKETSVAAVQKAIEEMNASSKEVEVLSRFQAYLDTGGHANAPAANFLGLQAMWQWTQDSPLRAIGVAVAGVMASLAPIPFGVSVVLGVSVSVLPSLWVPKKIRLTLPHVHRYLSAA